MLYHGKKEKNLKSWFLLVIKFIQKTQTTNASDRYTNNILLPLGLLVFLHFTNEYKIKIHSLLPQTYV